MLHPSYNDLMNVVNSDVEPGEHPVVNSRYSIVLATAKRARQLIDGSKPLVTGKYPKPLSIAIDELSTSAIKINSEGSDGEEQGGLSDAAVNMPVGDQPEDAAEEADVEEEEVPETSDQEDAGDGEMSETSDQEDAGDEEMPADTEQAEEV